MTKQLLRQSGVYRITNLINNKIYIGSSVNFILRWRKHRQHLRKNKHFNRHLQNAWNQYGEQKFIFEILEDTAPEKTILLERENYWIEKYNSFDDKCGYNIRIKAESCLGVKRSAETRKKISLAKTGKKMSDEIKEKISNSLKGESNHFFGKHHTDESKKRMGSRGEKHFKAKLCLEDVRKIRSLFKSGKHTNVELATMFKVHNSQITRIIKNQTWREINE